MGWEMLSAPPRISYSQLSNDRKGQAVLLGASPVIKIDV